MIKLIDILCRKFSRRKERPRIRFVPVEILGKGIVLTGIGGRIEHIPHAKSDSHDK